MTPAGQVTSDIKWLLCDAGLDHSPVFRVTTKSVDTKFETVVSGCRADSAQRALEEYARNHHDVRFDRRVFDGALVVIHDSSARRARDRADRG